MRKWGKVKKCWDNKNDLSLSFLFFIMKRSLTWHWFLPNFLGTT
jgi:hypothetical protein